MDLHVDFAKRRNRPGVAKNNTPDQRVSVCTDCKYGIFKFHEYVWTSRGLVHRECDEAQDAA